MATISLTIPDAVAARVTAAFLKQYPDKTPKQVLARIVKDIVRNAEGPDADATAHSAWSQQIETDLGGIQ